MTTLTTSVTCPLCHTTNAALSTDAVSRGASWRCVRCSQHWDSRRLEAVAASQAYQLEFARVAAVAPR